MTTLCSDISRVVTKRFHDLEQIHGALPETSHGLGQIHGALPETSHGLGQFSWGDFSPKVMPYFPKVMLLFQKVMPYFPIVMLLSCDNPKPLMVS